MAASSDGAFVPAMPPVLPAPVDAVVAAAPAHVDVDLLPTYADCILESQADRRWYMILHITGNRI